MGQTDPLKINILDVVNFAIPVRTKNVRQEIITNNFRHYKIRSGDAISENYNEPTSLMNLRSLINGLSYQNKMDVNNLLDYPSDSETC